MATASAFSWRVSVLVSVILYTCAQCETYHIKSTQDQPCPSNADLCYTLPEVARDFSIYSHAGENATLVFLPGNHTLNVGLAFVNLSAVSMQSNSSNSKSTIFCNDAAKFVFLNSTVVHVDSLDFIGCVSNNVSAVKYFILQDCSFIGKQGIVGTVLEMVNVVARIVRTSFRNNKGNRSYNNIECCLLRITATAGGAIVSESSHITIKKSHFEGNTAQIGGAIFSKHSDKITIISSTFIRNTATFDIADTTWCTCGGGAFHSGSTSSIMITDSHFQDNNVRGLNGIGGAISVATGQSSLNPDIVRNPRIRIHLANTTFIGNNADNKGGAMSVSLPDIRTVQNFPAIVTISNSKFINNTARFEGGGLLIEHTPFSYDNTYAITITDSEFVNNRSPEGGAIHVSSRSTLPRGDLRDNVTLMLTISNTNFLNNDAESSGGALRIAGTDTVFRLVLNYNNFTSNSANLGGASALGCNEQCNISLSVSMTDFHTNRAATDGGVFHAQPGATLIMEIVKSRFVGNSAAQSGGIVHTLGGNISISGSHFEVNTAGDQGGVIRTQEGTMSIGSSLFAGNVADFGGVVWAQEAAIYYRNTAFNNNTANVDGGVIHIRQSDAIIVRSTFNENKADNNGGTMSLDQGKTSVRICQFSNNTAGNDGGVVRSYFNQLVIKRCGFINNEAQNEGGVLWNDQCMANIQKSYFENSRANAGGAMYTDQGRLIFNETTFTRSTARAGAVLWSKKSNSIYGQSTKITDNYGNFSTILLLMSTAVLSDIVFADNVGSIMVQCSSLTIKGYSKMLNNEQSQRFQTVNRLYEGGALTAFQSTINIDGTCELQNNYAKRGGAIHAIESKVRIQGDATVSNNSATEAGGGILLDHSELSCLNGSSVIVWMNDGSDKGGGIMAVASSIVIIAEHSNILSLINNRAKKGGGIYFEMDTKLSILKSTVNATHGDILSLIHNSAEYGGAVYISDDGMCSLTTVSQCPFQSLAMYGPMPSEMDVYDTRCLNTMHFFNNTAQLSGDSLFGGLLDRCTVSIFAEPNINNVNMDYSFSNGTVITDGHEYLKSISNIEDYHINSHPMRVCFCREGQGIPDCSYRPEPIKIHRGQQRNISISVSVVNQIDSPLEEATIFSHFGSGNFLCQNHIQSMDGSCSKVEFSVESSNDTEQLILSIGEGPCENTPESQAWITLEYTCSRCPLGFEEDTTTEACRCVCDSKLFPFFTNCSGEVLLRDKNVWITSINTSNESTSHGYEYLVHPYCPHNYCHSSSTLVEVNLNIPNGADSQCVNNRSGLLCGTCQPGLTLSLGSSRCIKCPKLWSVTLAGVVIGSLLGGIILIALLLLFNLTVAIGTLNGIILYANIVAANGSIFLPFSAPNFVTIVISWMNLDIGFDACFFEGLNTFWKTLLQLAFPIYLIVLVASVIIISEHSTRFARLVGKKNPVATFSTLILLSYSKFLGNIIASMSFAVLKYPNGYNQRVWLPDATVGYLKGKHIALFVISLFILVAGITYTIILLFWQWLLRYQEWRLFSWMKYQKLCHFVEPYHAPYTTTHRYWTGLLLLVRVLLYVIAAFNVNGDPHLPLLAIIITTGSLLLLKGMLVIQIYKKKSIDALETAMYFNIVTFSALTWYFFDTGKNQTAIAYISVTITMILFLTVFVYHVLKYTHLLSLIKKSQMYDLLKSKVIALMKRKKVPKNSKTIQPSSTAKKSEPTYSVVELRASQVLNVTG